MRINEYKDFKELQKAVYFVKGIGYMMIYVSEMAGDFSWFDATEELKEYELYVENEADNF